MLITSIGSQWFSSLFNGAVPANSLYPQSVTYKQFSMQTFLYRGARRVKSINRTTKTAYFGINSEI